MEITLVLEVLMKNHTCNCVWRNIYNTARAYYKYFAKHACDFSLALLEPCNSYTEFQGNLWNK